MHDIYPDAITDMLTTLENCGVVLRLWNYPPPEVIHLDISQEEQEGFFCYFLEKYDKLIGMNGHRGQPFCSRLKV